MSIQTENVDVIERITNAALGLMVRRANAMTSDVTFTHADIVTAVVTDPAGETAHYFAQLIAWGIEWMHTFRSMPELLDIFGTDRVARVGGDV